jgi:hypothetical protein
MVSKDKSVINALKDIIPCCEDNLEHIDDSSLFNATKYIMPQYTNDKVDYYRFRHSQDTKSPSLAYEGKRCSIVSVIGDFSESGIHSCDESDFEVSLSDYSEKDVCTDAATFSYDVVSSIDTVLTPSEIELQIDSEQHKEPNNSEASSSSLKKETFVILFLTSYIWIGLFVLVGILVAAAIALDARYNWLTRIFQSESVPQTFPENKTTHPTPTPIMQSSASPSVVDKRLIDLNVSSVRYKKKKDQIVDHQDLKDDNYRLLSTR